MKKFIALLIISSSFWACRKERSTTTNNNNNSTDSIRYVVNTTNAQNWSGYYLDENNQKVIINNQGSGWQVSFNNKAFKPRALEISATTYGINPTDSFTIETKIYTNGNFVGFYFIKGTGNKTETCTSKYTMN
jgi:putative methionine-R-sulfoxide reductase with GAF domain